MTVALISKITKSTRICTVHFKPDDFIFSEFNIHTARRYLRPTAIPSIFPWTIDHHRTTVTSQIASSSKQRCELVVLVDEFDVNQFHNNFCSTTETIVSSDVEEIDYASTEETEDATKVFLIFKHINFIGSYSPIHTQSMYTHTRLGVKYMSTI